MISPRADHMHSALPMAASSRPRGRDSMRTRAALLAAAQDAFATRGYAHAGIREIAAAAGVNVSLVQRYFGSKQKLFAEALADSLDTSHLFNGPRNEFGRRAVEYFLTEAQNKANPQPIMILAAADPSARAITMELLHSHVVEPLALLLGPQTAEARAARIAVLTGGLFLFWKLLPLRPFASGIDSATIRWMEAQLQAIVDETEIAA